MTPSSSISILVLSVFLRKFNKNLKVLRRLPTHDALIFPKSRETLPGRLQSEIYTNRARLHGMQRGKKYVMQLPKRNKMVQFEGNWETFMRRRRTLILTKVSCGRAEGAAAMNLRLRRRRNFFLGGDFFRLFLMFLHGSETRGIAISRRAESIPHSFAA